MSVGVAVKVIVSTLLFNNLIFSLCSTPKRCSSSITNNFNLLDAYSTQEDMNYREITKEYKKEHEQRMKTEREDRSEETRDLLGNNETKILKLIFYYGTSIHDPGGS